MKHVQATHYHYPFISVMSAKVQAFQQVVGKLPCLDSVIYGDQDEMGIQDEQNTNKSSQATAQNDEWG